MFWRAPDGIFHENCAVFFKVTEDFGGLSNMAGGWPLRVNDIPIHSTEALYQACRFPHQPAWQEEIITQASPMAAKMKAKKDGRRANHSRPDWDRVSVEIMRWALRVKLAWHSNRMAALLRSTGTRAIVEKSRKDRVWGAVEGKDGVLEGQNLLGGLLMELRNCVGTASRAALERVPPLEIPDFLLLGQPIDLVDAGETDAP